jgi:hypothetical protein
MCDQTQGLPAQQIAPDSPVPFRSRETTAFPHVARMQSKRLRKLAGEGRNQTPSPQRGGCRTFLDRWAEARRGAANASCRMYCR